MHFRYVQRRNKGCVLLIMFSKRRSCPLVLLPLQRTVVLRDNCVDFFPLSSINNGHTLLDNLFIRLF